MDFLMELIFEIVVEGTFELGMSRRVPLPIRILAILVLAVVYGGLGLILLLAAVGCWQDEDYLIAIIFLLLLLGLVLMGVFGVRKKLRERKND